MLSPICLSPSPREKAYSSFCCSWIYMKPTVSCPLSYNFIGLLPHLVKDVISLGEHYFVRQKSSFCRIGLLYL